MINTYFDTTLAWRDIDTIHEFTFKHHRYSLVATLSSGMGTLYISLSKYGL